jgi:hypothetical protein
MDVSLHLHVFMVDKLADLLVLFPPIYYPTSLGTIQCGLAQQYWSRRSGDASALQTMQLLSMSAVGVK